MKHPQPFCSPLVPTRRAGKPCRIKRVDDDPRRIFSMIVGLEPQETTVSDSGDFRLPSAVVPRAYRLSLEPDLEALTFVGEVQIDLDVKTATREIVLHSVGLAIADARAGADRLELRADETKERITLLSTKTFSPGAATISLKFSGKIAEEMRGFYRSRYTLPDG